MTVGHRDNNRHRRVAGRRSASLRVMVGLASSTETTATTDGAATMIATGMMIEIGTVTETIAVRSLAIPTLTVVDIRTGAIQTHERLPALPSTTDIVTATTRAAKMPAQTGVTTRRAIAITGRRAADTIHATARVMSIGIAIETGSDLDTVTATTTPALATDAAVGVFRGRSDRFLWRFDQIRGWGFDPAPGTSGGVRTRLVVANALAIQVLP